MSDTQAMAQAIRDGDRRALARAITLVESTRNDHRRQAETLLTELLPHTGGSIRVGISGVPGVGKSTFIEALGLHVIDEGHKLAVLAVDPSSPRSGGSVLGDKTRMVDLAHCNDAYIRPSPSGGTLGGVARRTRDALLICETAGFDVVIVETVGVGQSETAVADLVDLFLLLLPPAGGDELQGIKKGIVELADLLVVNKADGDLAAAATRARRDYTNALHLLRPATPDWNPPVLECSALEQRGVTEVWQAIKDHREVLASKGALAERRAVQARAWMWSEVSETLLQSLRGHAKVGKMVSGLESEVGTGNMMPAEAARRMLAAFRMD